MEAVQAVIVNILIMHTCINPLSEIEFSTKLDGLSSQSMFTEGKTNNL